MEFKDLKKDSVGIRDRVQVILMRSDMKGRNGGKDTDVLRHIRKVVSFL